MKKFLIILLAVLMLAACSRGEPAAGSSNSDAENASFEKIKIVCTIFPQYDWAREIIGENINRFELELLVDSVADFHSFQPSISDIARISTADMFIYVGGHSDNWVENALNQAANRDIIAVNLVESLGDAIKMERLTEGMEHVCDDECEDDHHDNDFEPRELHEEEHIWVSLRMAQKAASILAEAIIAADPEYEALYRENLGAYIEKLSVLDAQYTAMTQAAEKNTLVFADRFPFLYLMDDYGLNYYAAFSGCSAESEASFSTIIILSRKVDDYELNYVMVTEGANNAIAESVISSTRDKNQQILVLHGMKSITRGDINNGVTYLGIMEDNLEVLRKALS
jgi:zinc transport system substrate-binding protein